MNKDIQGLLYGIKENIKLIEGGDTSEALLDEVRFDFLDLIELMKLFLISERDSYYGYFLMNMQFSANFYSEGIAGIKLNTFPPVFEANPLLLCKFSIKEILYIICHEIDHVVLNHPAEMVKANPTKDPDLFLKFNLAADAAVNDRIDFEIEKEKRSFLSHPDGVITSKTLSKMFDLGMIDIMENYAYYYDLIRDKGNDQKTLRSGAQSMMDEQNKKEDTEEESDWGTPGDEQGDSEDVKKIITSKNCGNKIQDHDWEAGDDEEDVTAAVKEFVNASVNMMNKETRGLMSAEFMSQVEKINKPQVLSWQTILKKYVGTITANKRKTRTRLNRRQPDRFDLSGCMDDKVLKIVVAIDTSGSVSNKMISQIFNEIFAILAKRKHDITVIECDSEVKRVYKAKIPADIKTKVVGRGGTMFSPVINYVNNDRYYRDALLIYFTDGYGESYIPKPRTYRNMWVVFGDTRHLSLIEPYGAVLDMSI